MFALVVATNVKTIPLVIGQTNPSGLGAFLPLILVAGLFLMLILPQRRMRKNQAQLQAALAVGEHVRTAGGIHGTIRELDDNTAVLEVESGRLRIERRAIVARIEA